MTNRVKKFKNLLTYMQSVLLPLVVFMHDFSAIDYALCSIWYEE